MATEQVTLLDCTLRDGGYYNAWDFSADLIREYLAAMGAIGADYVELGFRSLKSDGFKGGCAYTSDRFIEQFTIPAGVHLAVMVNASELMGNPDELPAKLGRLFAPANQSRVCLVRLACHVHEIKPMLLAVDWLKGQGYQVGLNLMQVADRSDVQIEEIAAMAAGSSLDILYFADSMGSLDPARTSQIVRQLRRQWPGPLGIHTHDNMGHALANSLSAIAAGLTWVDGTVTGMGRGPGNAKTEFLVLALEEWRASRPNLTPLLEVIRKHFGPMQAKFGWGSNPYYFLAGKYGIHPTFIQEMLGDSRYSEVDMLAVIDHLKTAGGKKFNVGTLEAGRNFFHGEPRGTWKPRMQIEGRDVLVLGSGPGARQHRHAIEAFIRDRRPFVIALNSQQSVAEDLIDIRAACHPVRILADCEHHTQLPQPLAIPASMLPDDVLAELKGKELLDFGLTFNPDRFEFQESFGHQPSSLVLAYALVIATSGRARRIFLAGFDGYGADDPRRGEVDKLFQQYSEAQGALPLLSLTPTRYDIPESSIYGPLLEDEA